MLRPSSDLVGCAFVAVLAFAVLLFGASVSSGAVSVRFPGTLLAIAVTVVTIRQLAMLFWRGGGLRRGERREHAVVLEDENTVWLGQVTVDRGMALEMWAINAAPSFPAIELIYSVRRIDAGPCEDPVQLCLPGRSNLPWLLRNRHARAPSRIFCELVPDVVYEYGISAVGRLCAPQSLRVHVDETLSLHALVQAAKRERHMGKKGTF